MSLLDTPPSRHLFTCLHSVVFAHSVAPSTETSYVCHIIHLRTVVPFLDFFCLICFLEFMCVSCLYTSVFVVCKCHFNFIKIELPCSPNFAIPKIATHAFLLPFRQSSLRLLDCRQPCQRELIDLAAFVCGSSSERRKNVFSTFYEGRRAFLFAQGIGISIHPLWLNFQFSSVRKHKEAQMRQVALLLTRAQLHACTRRSR